jgi:small nuclear ribonucleoprotein (snRNP)-like protein
MNKKYLISIFISAFSFAFASSLWGDAIILKDGTIYLGNIKSVSSSGIIIESFGFTRTLSQKEIRNSSKNIDYIQGIVAEILLKNGSVMKGTIQNYDDEVGLLLKTDYGSLTLPAKGIASIHDSDQKKKYFGPTATIGTMVGCYFPVGSFKNQFQIQPHLSVFAEINSVFLRSLYFGIDAGYMFMQYLPDRNVRFDAGTLKVYALYRFLDLRVLSSSARYFSPFISVGSGMTYIARRDNRPLAFGSSRKNEINAVYTAMIGLDIFATDSIIVRIQGSWLAIQQNTDLMNALSTGIGIMYGF